MFYNEVIKVNLHSENLPEFRGVGRSTTTPVVSALLQFLSSTGSLNRTWIYHRISSHSPLFCDCFLSFCQTKFSHLFLYSSIRYLLIFHVSLFSIKIVVVFFFFLLDFSFPLKLVEGGWFTTCREPFEGVFSF